jgi:nitrite reductase/ring-hydroxylating ferredoxin subunit
MLSHDENELLTKTGPGTAMGALIRRYWIPVVQSKEVEPGGRVKRVMLLGERLVAFRGTSGRPGLIGEFCPHRLASLYFGRVEEAGMRCVYHGWKYGLDGQCLEMPSEPPESGFASKVKHTAYPCEERGGLIWAYMGPANPPPPLPDLEFTLLPEANVFISKRVQDCNWFQAMEGGIDSSHISFLHAPIDHRDAEVTRGIDRASFGVGAAVETGDRAPRFDVADTEYGVAIGARRTQPDGRWYWRITQFLMPFYTMPPTDVDEDRAVAHLGADGRHPRGELDGDLAPGPQADAGGDPAPRRGQGRPRLRLRGRHLRALRRRAHRGQPRERLLHGLGGSPHPDVLRDPRLRCRTRRCRRARAISSTAARSASAAATPRSSRCAGA